MPSIIVGAGLDPSPSLARVTGNRAQSQHSGGLGQKEQRTFSTTGSERV